MPLFVLSTILIFPILLVVLFMLIWSEHISKLFVLGDLVVSMLDIGPKVHGFIPGRGRWSFKAIKISSTPFFVEKLKQSVPCHKILRHVKSPYEA
jgi:hypothetical protein